MFKSVADAFLKQWDEQDKKVFKFFSPLVKAEFVTFKKRIIDMSNPDDPRMTFDCVTEHSTTDLGFMSYSKFVSLLTSEVLVFEKDWNYVTDVVKLKTGGCNCGAWILKDNEYMHDLKCEKYRNPRDGSMPESKK